MGAPKDPAKRKKWIENLSQLHLGTTQTQTHKDNIAKTRTGTTQTQKTKDKIGKSVSGENNPMYNKKQKQSSKDKISKANSGEKNGMHKGDEYQEKSGRWHVWVNEIKYLRYRYVAMKCLGRELTKEEIVHHINEDPSDDRPENLYLFPNQGDHMKQHMLKNPPILISNINCTNI